VSHENPDPHPPDEQHPRMFSSTTIVGLICFALGLLTLATGILLAVRWLIAADATAALIGALLIVIGIGVNITGLVLLYRGVTGPGRGARNDDANP
jgi:hypothetical protein